MIKLAGLFLIAPFILAALTNISNSEDSERIDWSGANTISNQWLIEENPDQWRRDNLSAGLGGIIDAIGVVVFTFAVRQSTKDQKVVLLAIVSAVLVSLAAATWMFICINRFILPPSVVVQNLAIASWTTPAMDIPFVLGTLLLGVVVRQRYSQWGGSLIIAVEAAFMVFAYVAFREIPPWTHFLTLLITGIIFLIIGGVSTKVTGTSEVPVT